MKVGEYVRNKYGIAKVIDIENNNGIDILVFDKPICFLVNKETGKIKDDRLLNRLAIIDGVDVSKIKSSPNIIDLIEVGDYVNGCYVTNRQASHNEGIAIIPKRIGIIKCNAYFNQGNYNDCDFKWIEEEDIKSIVTKEVYASVEYRVETD